MKVISWVILACVILLGGYLAYLQLSPKQDTVLATYVGALPCADCEQLKTTLTLYENDGNPSKYTLEQVYVGKNVDPLSKKGEWAVQKGTKEDRNAVVYTLNSDQSKSRQLYAQKVNENELVLLTNNKGKIDSKLNFTLKKQ